MAVSTMRWGTNINGTEGVHFYTLPYPKADGIEIVNEFVGSAERSLGAELHVDRIAEKARIAVPWENLSEGERTTLRTAWTAYAGMESTLRLPNAVTYTVLAASFGWQENVRWNRAGQDVAYDVRLTFAEV